MFASGLENWSRDISIDDLELCEWKIARFIFKCGFPDFKECDVLKSGKPDILTQNSVRIENALSGACHQVYIVLGPHVSRTYRLEFFSDLEFHGFVGFQDLET